MSTFSRRQYSLFFVYILGCSYLNFGRTNILLTPINRTRILLLFFFFSFFFTFQLILVPNEVFYSLSIKCQGSHYAHEKKVFHWWHACALQVGCANQTLLCINISLNNEKNHVFAFLYVLYTSLNVAFSIVKSSYCDNFKVFLDTYNNDSFWTLMYFKQTNNNL
jgi:hypothetical protein